MTKKYINIVEEVTALMNNEADEQDLIMIHKWIATKIKALRTMNAIQIGATLNVGQKVEWIGKRGYQQGNIVKINRTRAVVLVDKVKWTVPMTMLKIVKG
jgi:hypothetical protein